MGPLVSCRGLVSARENVWKWGCQDPAAQCGVEGSARNVTSPGIIFLTYRKELAHVRRLISSQMHKPIVAFTVAQARVSGRICLGPV